MGILDTATQWGAKADRHGLQSCPIVMEIYGRSAARQMMLLTGDLLHMRYMPCYPVIVILFTSLA